jgi:hypothetical protein
MRKTLLFFGFCAVLVSACDTATTPRFAAAGPTGPSGGGGGGGHSALVIQPSQVEILVGGGFQLTTNAPGIALSWQTSNSAIAGVTASGFVTGLGAGIATITATSSSDPAQTASATVIVRNR